MKDLPEEESPRATSTTRSSAVDPADSEARVRLMTALAFWSHGFPTTTSPYREATLAEETGTAAAEMALRLGRPELAVVAPRLGAARAPAATPLRDCDGTRHATAWSSRKTAGDLSELGDSYAVAAWNAFYLGAFEEARALGLEGYDLMRADGPIYAVHCRTWASTPAFYLGDWDAVLHDLDLIIEGLGELAEDLTSGFAQCWPTAVFVHEARGNHEAANRLLDDVLTVESRRRNRSGGLTPLIVSTLLLRDEVAAARERLDRVYAVERHNENLAYLKVAEAEILAREERWTDADALVDELRRLHEVSAARYLPPAADRLAGRAALARGALAEGATLLGCGRGRLRRERHGRPRGRHPARPRRGVIRRAQPRRGGVAGALERAGYLRELARAQRLPR